MKTVTVVILLIAVASCSVEKRLARLLDKHPLPKDTIHNTVLVYRDTTVYEYLPGDTVEKVVELAVPVAIPDTAVEVCTDYACAFAGIFNNNLHLELVQIDTMVVFRLDSVLVEKYDTVFMRTEVPMKIEPKPTWRILTFVFGGLFILFMFLLIFFATRKK